MSNTPKAQSDQGGSPQLESGTYEIIRQRLEAQASELHQRLDQLNSSRKSVFGAIETALIANDRINTSNFCEARDILALGKHTIFGYNVHIGLRAGIQLNDVFSIYEFRENNFHETDLQLLEQEKFETDFHNLYRYYKDAFFSRFLRQGAYLYMLFQISKNNPDDYKAFKWLIKDEELIYIDGRSEHEIRIPAQYEFKWQRAQRDMQRTGQHPHVSIMDRLFAETVGGDLTIKVEDNTDDGRGIYREEVEYKDQTLDDAEYFYADLGNLIALKIRPYQEKFRYFVYNEKLKQVERIDSLEDSGVLLPDGHGLIFANGFYLQTGEYKIFDPSIRNKRFIDRIVSPNGEDFLYIFYNRFKGTYVLLHYNLIEQKVATPIYCHGFTIFPKGELCYFKAEEEPTKHHLIQIWQTPFVQNGVLPSEHTDTYLYKVGNKDVVKAMAECHEILTLCSKDDTYTDLYDDLAKKCTDVLDSYYWIDQKETFRLSEPLREIHATATAAIDEYEKKVRIQRNTENAIAQAQTKALDLFQRVRRQSFDSVDLFVRALADLRTLRGEIISLKDLRYTDLPLIEELESQAEENSARLSEDCIGYLLEENALQPYREQIQVRRNELEKVASAKQAEELEENADKIGEELQLLIEVVSNLKIEDTTQTTRIIDSISGMYGELNQLKAAVKRSHKNLAGTEAKAEFAAQLKLLDQGLVNYLDMAATPERCDDFLTKLMVQLEELESKFAEFDDFILTITEKREEVFSAFENRKKQLLEALNNRTSNLLRAGERILNGIQNRVKAFTDQNEINGFFSADLMVDKVRDIIDQLMELEDTNKADSLQTQLKTLKEEAIRQLRDKQDLFLNGQQIIKLGKHRFSVNVQPLDLTIVQQEGKLFFHLTGTDFYEEITAPEFLKTRPIWSQNLPSEDGQVYRSEFLAYQLWQDREQWQDMKTEELADYVRQQAATRYLEGYTKGVHDQDATQILQALLDLSQGIELLHYAPDVRAFAQLVWNKFLNGDTRKLLQQQLDSARNILEVFPDTHEYDYLIGELASALSRKFD